MRSNAADPLFITLATVSGSRHGGGGGALQFAHFEPPVESDVDLRDRAVRS